jgi:hypothetical protein
MIFYYLLLLKCGISEEYGTVSFSLLASVSFFRTTTMWKMKPKQRLAKMTYPKKRPLTNWKKRMTSLRRPRRQRRKAREHRGAVRINRRPELRRGQTAAAKRERNNKWL